MFSAGFRTGFTIVNRLWNSASSLLVPSASSWLSRGKKYKIRTLSSLKLRFRYVKWADSYVRRKANLGHLNLKKSHARIQRLRTPTFVTLKQATSIKRWIGGKGNVIGYPKIHYK